MEKLKEIIKKQDSFGYSFNFKFNKKDETYNTLIGGLASIALNIVMIYMFGQQLAIMLSKSQL